MAEEETPPVQPRLRRLRRIAVVEPEAQPAPQSAPLCGSDPLQQSNEGATAPGNEGMRPKPRPRRRVLRLVTAEELELAQGQESAGDGAVASRGSSQRTPEEEAEGIRAFREKLSQQDTRRRTRRALSIATTEDVELAQDAMGLLLPKRQRGGLSGLVDSEEESDEGRQAQGVRNPNAPVRTRKRKAEHQPPELLEERELVFPTRQTMVRTASSDLFEEEEDDEARFIRQRSTLQKLRSRLQVRKVRATPSHAMDLMQVHKDLSAPQMTFDLQDDEHGDGDALAVDIPEELTERVSKRTLWKEQLARTKSRQWAEGLCSAESQEQLDSQMEGMRVCKPPCSGKVADIVQAPAAEPECRPQEEQQEVAVESESQEQPTQEEQSLQEQPPQPDPQPRAPEARKVEACVPTAAAAAPAAQKLVRPMGSIAQLLGVTYRRALRKRRRLRQLREALEEVNVAHLDHLIAAAEEKVDTSGCNELHSAKLEALPHGQQTSVDAGRSVEGEGRQQPSEGLGRQRLYFHRLHGGASFFLGALPPSGQKTQQHRCHDEQPSDSTKEKKSGCRCQQSHQVEPKQDEEEQSNKDEEEHCLRGGRCLPAATGDSRNVLCRCSCDRQSTGLEVGEQLYLRCAGSCWVAMDKTCAAEESDMYSHIPSDAIGSHPSDKRLL
mmetsp:Transcript_20110/g.45106  ORF Transcript_20110/g.45106 Transcript_20110/m.45106 type:complete len:665 (-) Transcript_20110:33-2027(-)